MRLPILFLLIFLLNGIGSAQSTLVNVKSLSADFSYDIRYATTNNFMEMQLYDCAECLLRPAVAEALHKANQYFLKKGFKIILFDCYRPLEIQKMMWEKIPNAAYVANPYEGGSVHNRGAAVDLTLTTLDGCELNMGTEYDFFGREAHIDNLDLPMDILENRRLLFEGMKKFGFQPIRTEWWHFSYLKNYQYGILNDSLPCP